MSVFHGRSLFFFWKSGSDLAPPPGCILLSPARRGGTPLKCASLPLAGQLRPASALEQRAPGRLYLHPAGAPARRVYKQAGRKTQKSMKSSLTQTTTQHQRLRFGKEEQGSAARNPRQGVMSTADFATTRGSGRRLEPSQTLPAPDWIAGPGLVHSRKWGAGDNSPCQGEMWSEARQRG